MTPKSAKGAAAIAAHKKKAAATVNSKSVATASSISDAGGGGGGGTAAVFANMSFATESYEQFRSSFTVALHFLLMKEN
jgi:hypothetical protein